MLKGTEIDGKTIIKTSTLEQTHFSHYILFDMSV